MARPGGGAEPEGAIDMLCRYRVKKGKEADFARLLADHWRTLHRLGLATDRPARVLHCQDKAGNIAFVELFSWKTGNAAHTAHQTPEVMHLWEPMGALCDDMEFWNAHAVEGASLWS